MCRKSKRIFSWSRPNGLVASRRELPGRAKREAIPPFRAANASAVGTRAGKACTIVCLRKLLLSCEQVRAHIKESAHTSARPRRRNILRIIQPGDLLVRYLFFGLRRFLFPGRSGRKSFVKLFKQGILIRAGKLARKKFVNSFACESCP